MAVFEKDKLVKTSAGMTKLAPTHFDYVFKSTETIDVTVNNFFKDTEVKIGDFVNTVKQTFTGENITATEVKRYVVVMAGANIKATLLT